MFNKILYDLVKICTLGDIPLCPIHSCYYITHILCSYPLFGSSKCTAGIRYLEVHFCFSCMEKFVDRLLLYPHFYDKYHFIRLLQQDKNTFWFIGRKFCVLPYYRHLYCYLDDECYKNIPCCFYRVESPSFPMYS